MTEVEFKHQFGRSCYLEDGNNDDLKQCIMKYKKEILKVFFINKKTDWNTSTVEELRKEVKKILIERQKDGKGYPRCAYCRMQIRGKGENGQIDHILYKNKYIHLMFSPYNLILSCANCNENSAKGAIDLLSSTHCEFIKNINIESYKESQDLFFRLTNSVVPFKNSKYQWVHPYFDNYFECIKILIDGSTILYSEKENATSEQKAKAREMIDKLGFYRAERNVNIQPTDILQAKEKANLDRQSLNLANIDKN